MTENRIGVDQPSAFSKIAIQMLLGALLIAAATPALSQQAAPKPAFQPPTATELFKLRATCEKLGQDLLDQSQSLVGKSGGYGAHTALSVTSRYNPADGHCYVTLTAECPGLGVRIDGEPEPPPNCPNQASYQRNLFDGQTGETLAVARIVERKKSGAVYDRQHVQTTDANAGFDDANAYIDSLILENRGGK
jgi:hypothetical protein